MFSSRVGGSLRHLESELALLGRRGRSRRLFHLLQLLLMRMLPLLQLLMRMLPLLLRRLRRVRGQRLREGEEVVRRLRLLLRVDARHHRRRRRRRLGHRTQVKEHVGAS